MSAAIRADRAARARAIDPDVSFIVQAPAGSGKTELLTQRFLALLARVDAPEEALALTFTRKAAGEMRNRVLEALDRAAAGPEPGEEPHKRLTRELGAAVLETDRARGWELRRNPARLRILTLDALCASLARRMPVLSGFGAPPRIVEDAEPLYHEAARLTIDEIESGEQWSEAVAHLLNHLDNHLPTVEVLIARMLAQRDQWLRHLMNVERAALEAALAEVVGDALAALRAAVPDDVADELTLLLRYAADNLAAGGATTLQAALAHGLPGVRPEDAAAWCELAGLLLTREFAWRATVTAKNGFPAPGNGADAAEKALFKDRKDRMLALLARLRTEETLRQRLAGACALPPPRYSEEQWDTVDALAQLLRVATAMLEVTFRERGEVDFIRVALAARAALGAEDHPTDLALLLDERIRHILVDEFQDTSLGQFQLLERLTAGWEPGDGRTLFIVGDPMQSIYRFREAEVGLYLRARRDGIGAVALEPLRLAVNYRSQQGIIDWVNTAFPQVLPADEDVARGAVSYAPSIAHHPRRDGEAVTVHPFIGGDPQGEGERVLELVRAALAEDQEGTVAILVRNRKHLAASVQALKAGEVRFRAVEIEHLGHRPVIQDLIALACALTHPGDRLSWLAVLRAPWCGLTLHDLHALVADAGGSAVWTLIEDPARRARLSADGQQRLERLRAVFGPALAARRRRSLRRQVEGAWLALGGPACVDGRSDLEDAGVLFDLFDQLGAAGDLVDRQALMTRLERLSARPDTAADARLQIMTIHKAKGLEFDTVIVPGLGRQPATDRPSLLMWLERPQGDLLLAPIRESGAGSDPIYHYIAGLQREKSLLEDGRLLYVAATRAKRRLHLLGHVGARTGEEGLRMSAPQAQSLLARLWPVVAGEFAAAARLAPPGDGGDDAMIPAAPPAPLRRLVADWALPAAPAALTRAQPGDDLRERDYGPVEFQWAGEAARHVGTVTHRLLQHCGRRGVTAFAALDPARVRTAAAVALSRLGMPATGLEAAVERVVAALEATLEDARGRWILDPGHREARCEYALSTAGEQGIATVIIDRTFIDADGVRWIVDYKTGAHEGGGVDAFLDREQARYREQLERYASLISRRESRPIRLGLYFPLLRGWREWEYVSAPDTGACP
jgi:ATP-dependent helicase/nuclease subunit A